MSVYADYDGRPAQMLEARINQHGAFNKLDNLHRYIIISVSAIDEHLI